MHTLRDGTRFFETSGTLRWSADGERLWHTTSGRWVLEGATADEVTPEEAAVWFVDHGIGLPVMLEDKLSGKRKRGPIPKAEETRTPRAIRMTGEEWARVLAAAKDVDLSASDYVRGVLFPEPPPADPPKRRVKRRRK